MALTLDLSYTSETPDGDGNYTSILTDETTYGGVNPARADGVTYISGEKINYDSSVDSEVEFVTYNPVTASTYTFTTYKDGWYKFLFCWIPNYDAGETYEQYDAVYYSGVVYRAILDNFSGQTPTNTSYWEVISEPTDLVGNLDTATESANIAVQLFQIIIYPFAKKLYGDKAEEYAINCCGTFKDLEEFNEYKQLGGIVAALQASNTRQRYASGERIARYAASLQ
jgi:hypothetical protein